MTNVITVPSHTKKDNPKAALKSQPRRQWRGPAPTSSSWAAGDRRRPAGMRAWPGACPPRGL